MNKYHSSKGEDLIKKLINPLFIMLLMILFSCNLTYSQELSISEIAERSMPSVVQIVIYDITGAKQGIGSGFFISPTEILTNAHVIEDAYSAEIFSKIGSYGQIKVLKIDKEVDLALLEVEAQNETPLVLETEEEIRPGQRIITIGNPMGLEKTISDGLISALRGIHGVVQVIQISAPISPGSSGGPLLNMRGHVIGVTSAMVLEGQNLNFAIGIDTINKFLKRPDYPQQLHLAKSKVLWRVILKWVKNVIIALIAFAFGGGWWIIGIIVLVISLIVWISKGLYKLIIAPFKKRRREIYEESASNYELSYGENLELSTKKENLEEKRTFTFHCWKCGEEIEIDSTDKLEKVECWNCGTVLLVPKEDI